MCRELIRLIASLEQALASLVAREAAIAPYCTSPTPRMLTYCQSQQATIEAQRASFQAQLAEAEAEYAAEGC